jgi:hypothetical protein
MRRDISSRNSSITLSVQPWQSGLSRQIRRQRSTRLLQQEQMLCRSSSIWNTRSVLMFGGFVPVTHLRLALE